MATACTNAASACNKGGDESGIHVEDDETAPKPVLRLAVGDPARPRVSTATPQQRKRLFSQT
jgi:hypothetical protein